VKQNFRSVTNMLVDRCLDRNYIRWTSTGAKSVHQLHAVLPNFESADTIMILWRIFDCYKVLHSFYFIVSETETRTKWSKYICSTLVGDLKDNTWYTLLWSESLKRRDHLGAQGIGVWI